MVEGLALLGVDCEEEARDLRMIGDDVCWENLLSQGYDQKTSLREHFSSLYFVPVGVWKYCYGYPEQKLLSESHRELSSVCSQCTSVGEGH
jgi:hypothetical protein